MLFPEPKWCAIPGPFINELLKQSQILSKASLHHVFFPDHWIGSTMDHFSRRGSKSSLKKRLALMYSFLMSVCLCCLLSPNLPPFYIVIVGSLENMTFSWNVASEGCKGQTWGQKWRFIRSQQSALKLLCPKCLPYSGFTRYNILPPPAVAFRLSIAPVREGALHLKSIFYPEANQSPLSCMHLFI